MSCLPQSQWQITSDPNCPGMGGDAFLQAFMAEEPSQHADAPKDPVLASQAFNTEALLGIHLDPTQPVSPFIGFLGPAPAPVVAPVVATLAAAPAALLGGIGALGIAASLATGAPPPVESLTGSGLDPEPGGALAPPAGPPGGIISLADELPPNWWELSQGGGIDVPSAGSFKPPTWWQRFGDITAAITNTVIDPLLDVLPGMLTHMVGGTIGQGPAETNPVISTPGLPEPDQPVPGALPVPEIVVTGDRPARAPLVVGDPYFAPGGLPEPGLAPGPSPAIAPARQPGSRPRVAPVPVGSPAPVTGSPLAPARAPVTVPTHTTTGPVGANPRAPGRSSTTQPIWTPTPQPPEPAEWADIGNALQVGQAQKTCKDQSKQKKKQKKHARTVCHIGTYRELKSGLIKHATRTIPCQ